MAMYLQVISMSSNLHLALSGFWVSFIYYFLYLKIMGSLNLTLTPH